MKGFEPLVNEDSRILILGSMPSVKSLEKGEYYGNKQNRFWAVISAVFSYPLPTSYSEKKKMLKDNKIALWDSIECCEREGSLDSNIKNATPTDIKGLLKKYPSIKIIVTNGKASQKYFEKANPDLPHLVMPSTSPANALYSLDKLIEKWKEIKTDI